MAKAMDRINIFETFGAQSPVKIFFTYSVNAVAGNMGPALIDKQIMLI